MLTVTLGIGLRSNDINETKPEDFSVEQQQQQQQRKGVFQKMLRKIPSCQAQN
jgi:hypothetical protein